MQPKEYSKSLHNIPPEKIDGHAFYIIEKLKKAGFKAFLVGGSVRDLLLNVRPKDFDISTSAKPEEIKKLFKSCILIGKRFRLAHVRFGRKILEVSTFRSGENDSSLITRDNVWGNSEEDVLRRDFTINGLFYDPEKENLIDYVGGFEDAKKKLLRTIGDPNIRFQQDPVRMLRLAKFTARFEFHVEEKTLQAMQSCRQEITKSSPARVLEEILRMLESGKSQNFFLKLKEYQLLHYLLPQLENILSYDHHPILSYLDQADIFVQKNHPQKPERALLISCLLFPLMDQRLKNILEQKKPLHLGIITSESKQLVHDIFMPFFHLPKRMKAQVVSILTNQYRLTPIIPYKKNRIRIPKDPFFSLALNFFTFRCNLNPKLFQIFTRWNAAFVSSHIRNKKRNYGPRKNR